MDGQSEQRNGEATDRNGETIYREVINNEKTEMGHVGLHIMDENESQNKLRNVHQYMDIGNEADQERTGSQQLLRM